MADIVDTAALLGDDDGEDYDLGQDEEAELLRDDDDDEAVIDCRADPLEDEEDEESHRDKFASERQNSHEQTQAPLFTSKNKNYNEHNNFRKKPLLTRGGRRGRGGPPMRQHYNNVGNRIGTGKCYINPSFLKDAWEKKPVQSVQPWLAQMNDHAHEQRFEMPERRVSAINIPYGNGGQQLSPPVQPHQAPPQGQYQMPINNMSGPPMNQNLNWQPPPAQPQHLHHHHVQHNYNNYDNAMPLQQPPQQCYPVQPIHQPNQQYPPLHQQQQQQQYPYEQPNNYYPNVPHSNYPQGPPHQYPQQQQQPPLQHQPNFQGPSQQNQPLFHAPPQHHPQFQPAPHNNYPTYPQSQQQQYPANQPPQQQYPPNHSYDPPETINFNPPLIQSTPRFNHSQEQFPHQQPRFQPQKHQPVPNNPAVSHFPPQQHPNNQFRPRGSYRGNFRFGGANRDSYQCNQGYQNHNPMQNNFKRRVTIWNNDQEQEQEFSKRRHWNSYKENHYENNYKARAEDFKEEYVKKPEEPQRKEIAQAQIDTKPEIEEDEETRAYRRKIEEQKRQREAVLAQKEKNRKLAILQKTGAAAPTGSGSATGESQRIVKPSSLPAPNNPNLRVINVTAGKPDEPQLAAGSSEADNVPSSFLATRKVIAKDDALLDTPIVIVRNLAASTTEPQLRKLCHGVGLIQSVAMSSKERKAKIHFKSVASAHMFYKKYQRYMLDLSMIQVELVRN